MSHTALSACNGHAAILPLHYDDLLILKTMFFWTVMDIMDWYKDTIIPTKPENTIPLQNNPHN
jgi:hypothetical protein